MTQQELFRQAKILIIDETEETEGLQQALYAFGYEKIWITKNILKKDLAQTAYKPDLVIIKIPVQNASLFDKLQQLKSNHEATGGIPILLLADKITNFNQKFSQFDVTDIILRPYDDSRVMARIHNLIEVRLLQQNLRHNSKLIKSYSGLLQKSYDRELELMQGLVRAIESRDSEMGMHLMRMSHYSARLATEIGLSEAYAQMILQTAPLHDIGKIGIPDNILQKTDPLDPDEWEVMKRHTILGEELLSNNFSKHLELGSQIALTHHEKWNGSGYPYGLKGEDIPLIGRICGICDVFDALTSERPYKAAWPVARALREIAVQKGKFFDPKLVDKFLDISSEILEIKENYTDEKNYSLYEN